MPCAVMLAFAFLDTGFPCELMSYFVFISVFRYDFGGFHWCSTLEFILQAHFNIRILSRWFLAVNNPCACMDIFCGEVAA